MKLWCKILPFFIVEWWAKKNCEIIGRSDEMHVVRPFNNVEIAVPANPKATKARHAKWREGAIKTAINSSKLGD